MRDEEQGRAGSLPPTVSVDLHEEQLSEYWKARAAQHTQDTYAGVTMSKFPEDLRVYEHLLWLAKPDVVIEPGVQFGGSTLWWRDRLADLRRYGHGGRQVVGIELDPEAAIEALSRVDPDWRDSVTCPRRGPTRADENRRSLSGRPRRGRSSWCR